VRQSGLAAFAAAAVLALAACRSGGAEGHATLWVTRDNGAHVLLVRRVPAGTTALQALDRVADIKTRYGGRFVQSIEGVGGSLTSEHDWFWFVNGYEGDRSAAEYRLHAGDVEWWDFRSWRRRQSVPVVVGAFPEPFLHGFGGKRRASVVQARRADAEAARQLARLLHGRVSFAPVPASAAANVLVLGRATAERFYGSQRGSRAAGAPVRFVFLGDPRRLARNPALARFRYSVGAPQ
jgi:hypothetical protein